MVDDVVFFIVLGLLIVVVALFVFMMYKIKQQFSSPLMGAVMTSLHASLFGYESAMIDMIGTRGYKSHVFPKIVQVIKENAKNSPLLEEFIKSKDKTEAMQNWMNILKKAGVSKKDGSIKYDASDDSYIIDIPHCMMCDPIHNMIGETKGICPMALILTAAGTVNDSTVEAQIEYSKFIPTGTVTKVKFVKASA